MRGFVGGSAGLGGLALAQGPLVEGKAESPVRVLIFEDLACSDCADLRVMMDKQVLPKYGGKVRFEHRDFPLPKHVWAKPAAIAARHFAGIRLDLGVEFRRETLANMAAISPATLVAHVRDFAKKHGQDPASAEAALQNPKLVKAVEEDYEDGVARGIARTPTVLVEGGAFIETIVYADLARALDKHLAAVGGQ